MCIRDRVRWMKKYEYKMIKGKTKLGFDYDKKVAEMEAEWNQLGLAGWKFCTCLLYTSISPLVR